MTTAKRTRRVYKTPGYLLHKPTGQARVRINGVDHYLGVYGSDASRQKYGTLIAEHAAGVVAVASNPAMADTGLTILEITLAYLKHCHTYYVKDGKPTDEIVCIKSAVQDLVELYGNSPANSFGPIALKTVREKMIQPKQKKIGRTKKTIEVRWCRRYINMSVNRIRRMFKWAVENELVEPTVLTKLQAVSPLMAGRTAAREHEPRFAVSDEAVDKVKGAVKQRTKDMIDLWLLTGARPGELVKLTGAMIDRTTYKVEGVWIAEIKDHKMSHKGSQRILVFGPKAQLILARYIDADPTKRLFPINRATASENMKRACKKLNIQVFTAHWLRHTAGTRIRDESDLDTTQATLGHAHADTTEIYSKVQIDKAVRFARDAG